VWFTKSRSKLLDKVVESTISFTTAGVMQREAIKAVMFGHSEYKSEIDIKS